MSARAHPNLAWEAPERPARATQVRTISRRPPAEESSVSRPGEAILVGRDVAPGRRVRERGQRLPLLAIGLVGAVLAGLLLSAVRTEIFRLRYQLGDAQRQEQRLDEARRSLTVEVRSLRDPMRLRQLAAERGFGRPAEVIELRAASHAGALRTAP